VAVATTPHPREEEVVVRSIVERQEFSCPAGAAHVFLERDFELRHGEERRVALHVRVPVFGMLYLDKDVDVVMSPSAAGGDRDAYEMDVSWEAAGGPFPRFSGLLRIEPVGDGACVLELAGRYEPPGGVAGAAFDALLGNRVAQASLRELVTRIGRSVSAEYDRRVRSAVV
jgi:hypothetical protein